MALAVAVFLYFFYKTKAEKGARPVLGIINPLNAVTVLFSICFININAARAADLNNLTDAVMNGWRADYQTQMGSLIGASGCTQSVSLSSLTNAVMNGWRADYKSQMGALLNCSGCSQSVNLTKLTNAVMNGWRADYQTQMGSFMTCLGY